MAKVLGFGEFGTSFVSPPAKAPYRACCAARLHRLNVRVSLLPVMLTSSPPWKCFRKRNLTCHLSTNSLKQEFTSVNADRVGIQRWLPTFRVSRIKFTSSTSARQSRVSCWRRNSFPRLSAKAKMCSSSAPSAKHAARSKHIAHLAKCHTSRSVGSVDC